jgi:hypothetical protein
MSFVELELEFFDVIELAEICKHGRVQNGHADWEHLGLVVFWVVHAPEFELVHVLRGQKGLNPLESLLEVGTLPRPRI